MTRSRDDLLAQVERYYSGRLREHGRSAQGVDWNSAESQHLRFDQLLRCLEPAGRFTINDFGCGYGELARHLAGRRLDFGYVGFDVSAAMIEAAEEHAGDLTGCTFTADVEQLPIADYTVASGLFNVKLDTPAALWEEYVWETIALLDAHSSGAFAFNVLTAHSDADRMRADLFYADPADVLDRCLRTFSRHSSLVHDYGLYEFTVVVRREPLTT
jgi:SAM-dependent methyltransferase